MDACHVIRLDVPASLGLRDLALRTVSAACKLAVSGTVRQDPAAAAQFSMQVVSAIGEAFNNIAKHAYGSSVPGMVRFDIQVGQGWIRVAIEDFGASYDPATTPPPDLDQLPESGMGIFIMKSFMDEVSYKPGRPNTTTLYKRLGPT